MGPVIQLARARPVEAYSEVLAMDVCSARDGSVTGGEWHLSNVELNHEIKNKLPSNNHVYSLSSLSI